MILIPPPHWLTGPGSALTYGHKPGEPYGKLFLLIAHQGSYYFYRAWAQFPSPSQRQLTWYQLPSPPHTTPPRPDAAICYVYNTATGGEKVFAVFPGNSYIWSYDIPSQTWTAERLIGGIDPVGAGGSMEFWGFRTLYGQRVATLYLIKGGGSKEFMRYNHPWTTQAQAPFPYWEWLKPFSIDGYEEPFDSGADLAIYNPCPYTPPDAETIFAMRGCGKKFGLYRISLNIWERKDEILGTYGARIGGALVSHPKWGNIPGDLTDEINSILHCFRGASGYYYWNDFDAFDPPNLWNADPPNPGQYVASGSDLAYGACWYSSSPSDSICGLWAIFGNNNGSMGFYARRRFPSNEGSGGQSFSSFKIKGEDIIISPNPARNEITFRLLQSKDDAYIKIYSNNGEIIYRLKLKDGTCRWNMRNQNGKIVPPGVYFYTINIENKNIKGKLVVNR